jgi:hypothetical protein
MRKGETHQAAKAWDDVVKLTRIQEYYFMYFQKMNGWHSIDITNLNEEEVWQRVRGIIDAQVIKDRK